MHSTVTYPSRQVEIPAHGKNSSGGKQQRITCDTGMNAFSCTGLYHCTRTTSQGSSNERTGTRALTGGELFPRHEYSFFSAAQARERDILVCWVVVTEIWGRGHDRLVNCVRTGMSKSVSISKTFVAANVIYSHKFAGHEQ